MNLLPSPALILVTGRFGEDGEVPVVGEEILVTVLVAADLGPASEALGTQVKVCAVRTAHAQAVYLILFTEGNRGL
jgi:hypothetical protein